MNKTKIDWCDSTWNSVTGCLHGCEYCYAREIAERFGGKQKYANVFDMEKPVRDGDGIAKAFPYSFSPTFHRYHLDDYTGKPGRVIFVGSMADLFGDWVPDEWINEVFAACGKAPQHTYLFLTKNPERYYDLLDTGDLPDHENMWYGISATDEDQLKRAVEAAGRLVPTARTFLSMEPLREDIVKSAYWDPGILQRYFDWFIVGAETGRRAGKILPERKWVENIVDSCRDMGKPVFLKDGRGTMEKIWGKPLIREYPEAIAKGKRKKGYNHEQ